jgi:CDP-paratose 2-epimerase
VSTILVTGGAGFIGASLVRALLTRGHRVVVLDDLSRVGSAERLAGLQALPGDLVWERAEVARFDEVDAVFRRHGPFAAVFHLAAQVAVTWAMEAPGRDFLTNALGSFHVIDAVRRLSPGARCVYMSSNKVYGSLSDLAVEPDPEGAWGRLRLRGLPRGVPDARPLDPETPYGVSKATGEMYFRDASRTYGLESVVLRASCVYGPRQSQQEDQGWVAWFARAVRDRLPLRLFGDGCTTRDLLYVDDLVDLYRRVLDGPPPQRGLVLNVGGGAHSARSLLEVVRALEASTQQRADLNHIAERPSDQRVFVTDTSTAGDVYGWSPRVRPEEGLPELLRSMG